MDVFPSLYVSYSSQSRQHLTEYFGILRTAEGVDYQWSKIVKALADADGPLAKTGFVKSAKVAPIALEGE